MVFPAPLRSLKLPATVDCRKRMYGIGRMNGNCAVPNRFTELTPKMIAPVLSTRFDGNNGRDVKRSGRAGDQLAQFEIRIVVRGHVAGDAGLVGRERHVDGIPERQVLPEYGCGPGCGGNCWC